ncbi:hypothetical protein Xmau_00603 [Xenorhabdus mauleonii]|uniref:Uncharacterized protein n=1 Tax=Xenorhabdus mauleonii TaxID=351675 RepID=A0A1I3JGM6_9GAMM|nr:hypothetical protein [Xenorhabdus mauleonii]PHM46197.1 hypothetical protein Xmau_00603 [Xenorhabdus mauleonii]SFI59075.1 hypothetical protein SAMN05421680_102198 [Xenorhabdus mauleonii]
MTSFLKVLFFEGAAFEDIAFEDIVFDNKDRELAGADLPSPAFLYLKFRYPISYTQWISSCIAAARGSTPGNIDNYVTVTGVTERSQQSGSLKDKVYII